MLVVDNMSREMPIGIQDFEKLRTVDCMYVDKTQYVYDLSRGYKPYFLSRPRRFGKSLFVSTLKAYFLGKKELFEGLAIAELEKDWITYPVIYIDFNTGSSDSLQSTNELLNLTFDKYEKQWEITEKYSGLAARFAHLIETAYQKTEKKVVVLVDEYDKALVNTMNEPQVNDELRKFFKGFYGVLKGMDYALRFAFLTGVSKFTKVSIFSDLNQLIDISLDKRYAEICGISKAELMLNFIPEIHALAAENEMTFEETVGEISKRYDGYRFTQDEARMFNPFSLLSTFMKNRYAYYWFKTGTTTWLAHILRNNKFDLRKFNNDIILSVSRIDEYHAGETYLVPLLFQTGYLTIKAYRKNTDEFILGFPNEEVKYGFLNELLPVFAPQTRLNREFDAPRFCDAIDEGDIDGFMKLLTAFYASIPYDAIKLEHRDEQYYQHLFYLLFTLMGQFVETEVKSATGRADAVVKTGDTIYVFEFKMDTNATAEDALSQIDRKSYLIPYIAGNRRLVKIGVEFSAEAKGIKRWLVDSTTTD